MHARARLALVLATVRRHEGGCTSGDVTAAGGMHKITRI